MHDRQLDATGAPSYSVAAVNRSAGVRIASVRRGLRQPAAAAAAAALEGPSFDVRAGVTTRPSFDVQLARTGAAGSNSTRQLTYVDDAYDPRNPLARGRSDPVH